MAKGSGAVRGGKSRSSDLVRPSKTTDKEKEKDTTVSDLLEHQQICLNLFRDTMNPHSADGPVLQEIKTHLYARDFASAFGRQEYLRVYASRWSPSRAVGYLQILIDLEPAMLSSFAADPGLDQAEPSTTFPLGVACLGGGAGAELVALAGWCQHLTPERTLEVTLIDSADWAAVVSGLETRIVAPPELSAYASAAAREANTAMLRPDRFHARFQQTDVLAWPRSAVVADLAGVRLVTLMFTLNELYSTSLPGTQQLLAHVTAALGPGALLLVVDSPGSYSSVALQGAEKKYPMVWLLDLAVLGPPTDRTRQWEKLVSDASRWFRLPSGLRYPIELENMRYQLHLYRRLGQSSVSD